VNLSWNKLYIENITLRRSKIMAILPKVRATLSLFRDRAIEDNFSLSEEDRYGNQFIYKGLVASLDLKGVDLEFVEEPKNVIAIGFPVKDIKVGKLIRKNPIEDAIDYFESDIKISIREDKISINKSTTHLMMYRIDYPKGVIIVSKFSTKTPQKIKLNPYDLDNLLNNTYLGHNFPFGNYCTVTIGKGNYKMN
jgi:hypothetical protein